MLLITGVIIPVIAVIIAIRFFIEGNKKSKSTKVKIKKKGEKSIDIAQFIYWSLYGKSVEWSTKYIEGAKSGSSFKKNRIYWDDIVSVKRHPNQSFSIKDKGGKSVYWSMLYAGWEELIDDLRRFRPDIDTSDFD